MKYKFYIFVILIALAVGTFFILSGGKEESPELKAMLASSAATAQLTTGREVSTEYQDRETKPLIGKPKQPKVTIVYEPKNNYTKEDVYAEIIAVLEESNWEMEELSIPQSGYYKATMPGNGYTLIAEVLIHSKSNTVSIVLTTVP